MSSDISNLEVVGLMFFLCPQPIFKINPLVDQPADGFIMGTVLEHPTHTFRLELLIQSCLFLNYLALALVHVDLYIAVEGALSHHMLSGIINFSVATCANYFRNPNNEKMSNEKMPSGNQKFWHTYLNYFLTNQ